jgi:hypothetical protein
LQKISVASKEGNYVFENVAEGIIWFQFLQWVMQKVFSEKI